MSVGESLTSDHQLARLLQIGVVLEELVEARAYRHYQSLVEADTDIYDADVAELLEHARSESAGHRDRLEELIEELDADTVPFEEIEQLVEAQYATPDDFDGVLYDQLAGEETAYKFYDDLIEAIEETEAAFSIDRERLIRELTALREDEAEGVETVTHFMQER